MSVASDIKLSAIFAPLPPLLPLLLFLPLYLMHCHENSYATRQAGYVQSGQTSACTGLDLFRSLGWSIFDTDLILIPSIPLS